MTLKYYFNSKEDHYRRKILSTVSCISFFYFRNGVVPFPTCYGEKLCDGNTTESGRYRLLS